MKHYLRPWAALIFFIMPACTSTAQVKPGYATDYHVHLQDSATVQLGYRMLKAFHQKATKTDSLCFDADTIIGRLNRAKFHSAWIISNAYWFGSPLTPVAHEYEEVKKQNDWIAAQAARYPDRLKALLSVNPLKPYALNEIERCAVTKHFVGIKLHFANSKVNLFDKTQVKQLQKVFATANKYGLLLLVHFRSDDKWDGAANTEILINQLLPFAANTKIIIAHMAGWGGYDRQTDKALAKFATYINAHKNPHPGLYFDISAVFPFEPGSAHSSKVAFHPLAAFKKQIRNISAGHILFGTDWPLIDIDPYIRLLNKNLGQQTTQQLLNTRITTN
ncbi:amidohydrolase family protein [Mucilaginibacter celer]|uniref:Amidohydrolase-related domain-containing protein n=1 Tax=Mucilaginibacter celer TaxID=2305508 RepID=A0A494VIU7_9SPHI|nr:amidohydrolase family protein [Mucilaginibacter celer]AYL94866.1 hypothetical protein HYN43_005915 [Mucilaginibacter celer]